MRRLVLTLVICGCGQPGPREVRGPGKGNHEPAPAKIVVSERAGAGSRLVLVDERGLRVRELTDTPGTPSADSGPAWSPDGRFVAFASSRGREDVRLTSLWIVALDGGEPRRLTDGAGIDITPTFSPDGRRLVFASTRGGGDLDLHELVLDGGTPRRLLETADAEVMPAFSPDGEVLAWAAVDDSRRSRILVGDREARSARHLTDGSAPWFSGDGTWLAFSAPAEGRADADLWRIGLDGSDRRPLAGSPLASETFPRFSRDGRLLFATAVVRGDDDKALLSTLVFLELDEREPRLRALQEPIPTSRNGVAVGPGTFDLEVLRANPSYTDALRRVLVE